jgi:hypothetical protein
MRINKIKNSLNWNWILLILTLLLFSSLTSAATIPYGAKSCSSSGNQLIMFPQNSLRVNNYATEWQKALNNVGVYGTSWFGKLASNGGTDNQGLSEPGRLTIIFVPCTTDFNKPVEIMYYYHGIYAFGYSGLPGKHFDDFNGRISPQIKDLINQGRNFVFVFPELPWSSGDTGDYYNYREDSGWRKYLWDATKGDSNLVQLHNDVLNKVRAEMGGSSLQVGYISMAGQSAGGRPLYQAAKLNLLGNIGAGVNKITFSDADYGAQTKKVFDNYVKSHSGVELNMLVQDPSNGGVHQPTYYSINAVKSMGVSSWFANDCDDSSKPHWKSQCKGSYATPGAETDKIFKVPNYPNINYVPLSKSHGGIGAISLAWTSSKSAVSSSAGGLITPGQANVQTPNGATANSPTSYDKPLASGGYREVLNDLPQRQKEIDEAWLKISGLIASEGVNQIWDKTLTNSWSWQDLKKVYYHLEKIPVASSSYGNPFSYNNPSGVVPLSSPSPTGKGSCFSYAISNSKAEAKSKLVSVQLLNQQPSVNKVIAPLFEKINQELIAAGVTYSLGSKGTFNWRCIKPRVNWAEPDCIDPQGKAHRSKHSYGTAIDMNPDNNPYCYVHKVTGELCDDSGRTKCGVNAVECKGKGYDIPEQVIQIFKNNDFNWGGDWTTVKDFMHFQWQGNIGDFNGDGILEQCPTSKQSTNTITGMTNTINSGVSGVNFQTYQTTCPSNKPELTGRTEGIIIPSSATKNPEVYFYFHGNTKTTENNPNFVSDYAKSKNLINNMQGKNAILIILKGASPNSCNDGETRNGELCKGWATQWFAGSNKFSCFYNEAIQKVQQLGYSPTSITFMGHSQGGKAINNVINGGFLSTSHLPLKNVVYYDACYGSYCSGVMPQIINSGGKIFFVWTKDGVSVDNKKTDVSAMTNVNANTWQEETTYVSQVPGYQSKVAGILAPGSHGSVPNRYFDLSLQSSAGGASSSNLNVGAPSTCTYTDRSWQNGGWTNVKQVSKSYSQITSYEKDPSGSGCTLCEEDQININVAGQSFKICKIYASQINSVVQKIVSSGFSINEIKAYSPGRTYSSGTKFSKHAYGAAIDFNKNQNGLYNNCQTWNSNCQLSAGGTYNPGQTGSITSGSIPYNAMKEIGWKWGGEWSGNQKDFMHFSPSGE